MNDLLDEKKCIEKLKDMELEVKILHLIYPQNVVKSYMLCRTFLILKKYAYEYLDKKVVEEIEKLEQKRKMEV